MTFDQLQEGDEIFLDANTFIYHFLGLSEHCKRLLNQCRDGLLQGRTASFILAETVHRLMVAEAVERGLVTAKNALKKLREKPEIVQQLHKHAESVQKIKAMNIEVAPLTLSAVEASAGGAEAVWPVDQRFDSGGGDERTRPEQAGHAGS